MSSSKVHRLLLALAFCAVGEGVASAIDLASGPEAPVSMAARPRIAQTAQPATRPASLQVGSAAPGALPGASPATLWKFMGIPQGIRKMQGATRNRNGNRPGREPKPPLKAIADPANLDPGNGPAINKAAEIKQKEDLAPQKIKALKYLATIGCGCYPGVEEALAKSLKFGDECTEEVRYEAALAIQEAAESNCAKCGKSCCCTVEMMQLLNDVATARDADGCFLEPSARVREAACQALLACRRRVPVYPAPPVVPVDGGEIIPREPLPGEVVPKESSAQSDKRVRPNEANHLMNDVLGVASDGGRQPSNDPGTAASTVATRKSVVGQETSDAARTAASRMVLIGSIMAVDVKTSTVDLEFQGRRQPTVGSQFSVHHDYALSSTYLGRVEVVYLARNGRAIAKPVGRLDFAKLGKGDRVTGRITVGDDEERSTSPASHAVRSKAGRAGAAPPRGDGVPQPPARSANDATTAAPSAPALPAGVTRTNAVPAKAPNSAKSFHDVAAPKKVVIAEKATAGQKTAVAAPQAKPVLASKDAEIGTRISDAISPWKKAAPAKTDRVDNNPWKNFVPAKASKIDDSLADYAMWQSEQPPAKMGKLGSGIADKTAQWKNALFGRIRGGEKRVAEGGGPVKNVSPVKPDDRKQQVAHRTSASPISSTWPRLTKPAGVGLHPSPVAPASASTDSDSSSVAGIVLLEE
ncbi:MAG TPA: hypothetical protein VNH11_20030 [Pirellulales bacterium]|nr:hypothetical protein [Pirellulales bacterium]